jgi:transcriptional regulator GlxA family with amidase domain
VKKALARLDSDAASPIRLTELAELARISRYQMLRAFDKTVEQRRETVRYNRSLTAGRTTSMPVGLFKW